MAEVRSNCCYCGIGCGQAPLRAPKEVPLGGTADRCADHVERRSLVLNKHG
jgi:hypothetical protein